MKQYTLHSDPGHAWLAVPLKDLQALGLEDQISDYSYRKGETIFLEEDCDASLFFRTMDAGNHLYQISEKHTDGDSFVRSLSRYY